MDKICQNYFDRLDHTWKVQLESEFLEEYLKELFVFLENERENGPVYPPQELIFNAFAKTPFHETKVVIMGQDPYHGKGQAHGLSFSVPEGIKIPPSLKNIFQELSTDLNIKKPETGSLLSWAKQGVLLLNATLSVREKEPQSHYGKGWDRFTNAVIKKLIQKNEPVVFVLWGKAAQEKCLQFLEGKNREKHLILIAPHPSPYSAHSGFFGCKHFSKINDFLSSNGIAPIDWSLS